MISCMALFRPKIVYLSHLNGVVFWQILRSKVRCFIVIPDINQA